MRRKASSTEKLSIIHSTRFLVFYAKLSSSCYHAFFLQVLRKINPAQLVVVESQSGQSMLVTKSAAATSSSGTTGRNLVFYDLGSGTGKAVFLARQLFDFRVCKGIELLEGLFQQSLRIL